MADEPRSLQDLGIAHNDERAIIDELVTAQNKGDHEGAEAIRAKLSERKPLRQHTESEAEFAAKKAMHRALENGDKNAYEAARNRLVDAQRERTRLGEPQPETSE